MKTQLTQCKLGYGGTKSEMERLLADASKLSGVEYNLDNLGDVYDAIHVIQEDLGLTGVAADEASSTFTGSLGAMKAAAENLMANVALGEDLGPSLSTLGKTVQAFVFNNLIPMLSNVLSAVPDLVSGLGSMIIQGLNIVSNNADQIVAQGIEIVTSLVTAIVDAAPYLVEAAVSLVASLGEALITTDWITVGTNLMNTLRDSISLAAGEILGSDNSTIDGFLSGITEGLPSLLESGVSIITEVANGILASIPQILTIAGEIATSFATFLMENAPTILESGAQLILNLVQGIISNLPQIVATVAQINTKFIGTIATHLPEILQQGILILGKLIAGLIQTIPKLVAALPQIINSIKNTFGNYDWMSIGINILLGIKDGILGAVSSVVSAAKEAASAIWEGIKGFFDINSPAGLTEWGGEMIDEGLAVGIKKNIPMVDRAVNALTDSTAAQLQVAPTYGAVGANATGMDSKIDSLITLLDAYLPQLADGVTTQVVLEGDAQGLFKVVRDQNKIYKRMNGESAFA